MLNSDEDYDDELPYVPRAREEAGWTVAHELRALPADFIDRTPDGQRSWLTGAFGEYLMGLVETAKAADRVPVWTKLEVKVLTDRLATGFGDDAEPRYFEVRVDTEPTA